MSTTRKAVGMSLSFAGATAAVGGVMLAAPAEAGLADCDFTEICLFENNDFNQGNTNNVHQWLNNDNNYTNNIWYRVGQGWTNDVLDNEASSIKNRDSQCPVWLHQYTNYGGANSAFPRQDNAGWADGFLDNNSIRDNRASSHSRCTANP